MILITLVLILSLKVIWDFNRMAGRQLDERLARKDLARTWDSLPPEGRAIVIAYYKKMKSEGRI